MEKREILKISNHDVFIINKRKIDNNTIETFKDRNDKIGKGRISHKCPLCKKSLKSGDEVTLIMSNNTLFPNIWAHDKCVKEKGKLKFCEEMRKKYLKKAQITN